MKQVKHVLQMHEMYVPALSENSFITNTSIMRSAYSVVLFQWGLLYAPWLRNDNKRKMKNLGVPIFHVLGSQSTSVPASFFPLQVPLWVFPVLRDLSTAGRAFRDASWSKWDSDEWLIAPT